MNDPEPMPAWYATPSPDAVSRAGEFYDAHAGFRDPFNDVRGVAAIETTFQHMFVHTDQPRFIIGERLTQGNQAFVTWLFIFRLPGAAKQISGGSHLRFNEDGLVVMHRDYWDAAEELMATLRLIGVSIRWLRGRFRIPMLPAATNGDSL
jgi:hypothetical protein